MCIYIAHKLVHCVLNSDIKAVLVAIFVYNNIIIVTSLQLVAV